ncbi:MAG: ATP-binding cassette domain-containing protein [Christensenellaceae bacterium]|nr:ATP-binding cassette domain-containing protein [Christensenellaceae bacterium]
MAKKLEVKNLIISFRTNNGTVKAVRDISFDIEKGETLAIVGESGSGKSVTARAIMGILANNAIPEGGEIIYDGQDLMQIDEEDFHKIRGNRISMIFQDPLSSLNPIVRIGTQLTEAMILNGKANQREARRTYSYKVGLLSAAMKSAGVQDVDSKIKIMNSALEIGSKAERDYNYSRERIESMIKNINDVVIDSINGEPAAVVKEMRLIVKDSQNAYNPFLIDANKSELPALMNRFKDEMTAYKSTGDHKATDATLAKVKSILEAALAKSAPKFFAMGYCKLNNCLPEFDGKGIDAYNQAIERKLNDGFLNGFAADVAKGLEYSNNQAFIAKRGVVSQLDSALSKMSGERIDISVCEQGCKQLAKVVEASLDRLAIRKDSIAYTFKTSIKYAVDTYKHALKVENRNHLNKRDREFKNRMDIELYQNNIRHIISNASDNYKSQLAAAEKIDYIELAHEMITYLDELCSKKVYTVTKRKAQIRAIELMEEVGITDARRRFRQYPFEFSGGMRQRIVIAIALAANPDILICDEPTTALDVTIQAQILELINRLKAERQLSIIFITHDLGVVANMADKIAVMYAGKIVEYGTADEVFYEPAHPYTWALLASMPDLDTTEKLDAIPGTPPNMLFPPVGDAFAERNKYAMAIDLEEQPPMFKISDTHSAATWLLHPDAPKVEPPRIVTERIERMKKLGGE